MAEISDAQLEQWLLADKKNLPSELHTVHAALSATLVPTVFLSKVPIGAMDGTPGCWLGGHPRLPMDIDWPWADYDGEALYPLAFVAQFDLARIPDHFRAIGIPDHGSLLFFASYEAVVDTDKGGVIYIEDDVSQVPLRLPPEMPENLEEFAEKFRWSKKPISSYDHCPVILHPYDAVEPNMLCAGGMDFDTQLYALASRALMLQDRLLQPKRPAQPEQSGRIWNWFRGKETILQRDKHTMHRLFGASTNYHEVGSIDPSVVRLLTVEDDSDWGFEMDGSWLGFFISADDLKAQNFRATYARLE